MGAVKVCPQCGDVYQDYVDFCFADGEVLNALSDEAVAALPSAYPEAPTPIAPPSRAVTPGTLARTPPRNPAKRTPIPPPPRRPPPKPEPKPTPKLGNEFFDAEVEDDELSFFRDDDYDRGSGGGGQFQTASRNLDRVDLDGAPDPEDTPRPPTREVVQALREALDDLDARDEARARGEELPDDTDGVDEGANGVDEAHDAVDDASDALPEAEVTEEPLDPYAHLDELPPELRALIREVERATRTSVMEARRREDRRRTAESTKRFVSKLLRTFGLGDEP